MRRLALSLAVLALAGCGALGSGRALAQDMGLTLTEPAAAPAPQTAQRLRPDIRPGSPGRMLVIGDSLAFGFGTLLVQRAAARGLNLDVTNRGRASTGLARADYYDWPEAFRGMAATDRPDIVVAHFGANDMQSVLAPEGRTTLGTEGWEDAYRAQIRKLLATAAEAGIVVYWLGPAPDGNPGLGRHLVALNPVYEDEARAHGAAFVALTPLTAPGGGFARTVTIGETRIAMRTADGSHFTGQGYAYVADHLLDRVTERFPQLGPVTATPAVAAAASPLALSLQ